jgi:hypothetical protein
MNRRTIRNPLTLSLSTGTGGTYADSRYSDLLSSLDSAESKNALPESRRREESSDSDVSDEEPPARNVRRRLEVGAREPSFVVAMDGEPYAESDDEQFNDVNDLYVIDERDRFPEAYSYLPDLFTIQRGVGRVEGIVKAILQALLERCDASECYRRRTLSKLVHRFSGKTRVDSRFFQLMRRVMRPLPSEDLPAWFRRLRSLSETSFLQLSIFYNLHRFHMLRVNVEGDLNVNIDSFYDQKLSLSVTYLTEALEEGDFTTKKELGIALEKEVKLLYRIRLLRYFFTNLRAERAELKRSLSGMYNLPASLVPSGLAASEDYKRYPLRGPFLPGFNGASRKANMYGARPNPQYFYCNCEDEGSLCGHKNLSTLYSSSVSIN